MKNNV